MANSKAISIRIPDELLEKIDRLAEEKYKSHKGTPNRSLVVLDAIVAYFDTLSDTGNSSNDISLSDSVSIAEFNDLKDIVITLSDNVKQLENKVITLSDTVNKLSKDIKLNPEDKQPKQGELDIIAMSDSVIALNGTELAKRLNVAQSMVSKQKNSQELASWSKAKDPESIAWSYNSETKKFSPIKPLA
jgi:metal-responsive CopG/Arc/MetJ family transcriptional regulator